MEVIMCDYSLEIYRTVPAKVHGTYQTHRFPTGSIGFITPNDYFVAVCMPYNACFKLSGILEEVQKGHGVPSEDSARFVRCYNTLHRDAVMFTNGAVLTLQELGEGVTAYVWAVPSIAEEDDSFLTNRRADRSSLLVSA